jgi:DNA primase
MPMPDAVIEQIKQRIDIIELLSEYLRLQKSGGNWRALCPFHHENSPSFMVSQDKQIWHCFGCDKGGDIFAFIQEMEGVDFPEALKILAQRANVTLTQYNPSQQQRKQQLLNAVALAQQFYAQALRQAPEANVARDYLTQRGLGADSIEQFGLGYSYADWSRLKDYLKAQGVNETDQVAAGLIMHQATQGKGSGYYDRFRGRVMIPLHDSNGIVVGFTARTLNPNEPAGKYINSPQSELYDKSSLVFGLFRAKQAIKKLNATLIMEGNLDVITAQQHGFPNAVGTSGTAFTEQQVKQLKRYSLNLLLAFDLDAAGEKAADRGIDLALKENMNIKVVRWPEEYKDPDECIRANPAAFKQAIRDAIGIVDYWFMQASKDLQLNRVEHKKLLVQRILPKLAKLSDPVEVAHYVQQLADVVRVDANLLQEQVRKLKGGQKGYQSNAVRVATQQPVAGSTPQGKPKPASKNRTERLADHAIGLLLLMPEQLGYAQNYLDPEFITDPTLGDLYKRMLDQYNKAGQFSETDFSADADLLGKLRLQISYDFPEHTIVDQQEALISVIRELHKRYVEQRLRDIEVELKQAELQQQPELANQLLQEAQLLAQQLTELSA